MKIPAMIAAELRRLTSTRMSVIALVALVCVPVLYGGLYLWANQDPYGRFAEIPVALVDADEGVPASGDIAAVDYGDQVAQELLEGRAFDWNLLDADAADAALHDGAVDFIVTIPADFSAALTSVAGDTPHQARIELETNDANNYLASTIGTQAVEKIRRSVAELVGSEAATRLLGAIADIRVSLVSAADGAAQLATGAAQASDGATQLASGSSTLADGTTALAAGAAEVAGGASQLSDGAAQVAAGTGTLAGYADRAGAASERVVAAVPQVRDDLASELAAQGLDQAQIDAVLATLDPLGDVVRDADARVQGAVAQVDRLAAGAADVAAGASDLAAGAAQVTAGADAAAAGAAQLKDGVSTLANGLGEVAPGAATLRDGLISGVDALPDSSAELRAQQAATIADPVAVESGKVAAASDYGSGLAPFFAALAGWIGIYALFLIVKPISKRAVTALHSPLRITAAGWLTPALLGAAQMAALFGVLALALGFGFSNPLGTLGVMVVAAATYAAIILALNVWLGSVGQFVGLVLMVLQLVTAGGTFPWQTLPAPLVALHHALPMGYVVDAMRQLMYGGDLARAGGDLAVLALWLVGALALAAVGVTRMTHRRTLRDLQPSLIG